MEKIELEGANPFHFLDEPKRRRVEFIESGQQPRRILREDEIDIDLRILERSQKDG